MKKIFVYSVAVMMGIAAHAGVKVEEGVVSYIPEADSQSRQSVDFSRAIPMEKRLSPELMDPETLKRALAEDTDNGGKKGRAVAGLRKGGKKSPVSIPLTKIPPAVDNLEYGKPVDGLNIPYTTSRVDMYLGINRTAFSSKYPYRASGQLFFEDDDGQQYICSASLIKRGVLVTAGHCVIDNSEAEFYENFQYIPARRGKSAPYGIWEGARVYVMSSYAYDKNGECLSGVVCKNDVAVIVLKPKNGKYAGDKTGWLGYGINTYSFTRTLGRTGAQITQLGYPASHDRVTMMQRNDSLGILGGKSVKNNTIIGTRMTGGSSGGPWIVNFGQMAKLGDGTTPGSEAKSNIVVGVTSWGYTNDAYKLQGASQFTRNNIVPLLKKACQDTPAACR
jgi:V8-like Glu-specific endopeptidase